jgi:SAM-dependent methyltransferase
VSEGRTEGGVGAEAFRPSSDRYGETAGEAVRCLHCGHGSLLHPPAAADTDEAYVDAADPVSLREEEGQVETARRALVEIERRVGPGRIVDVGCWTGSFLVAALERGWDPIGLEPSAWAAARARERALDVRAVDLTAHGLPAESIRLAVLCDVIEHLHDPGGALEVVAGFLERGGGLYLTLPDAGSWLARRMGSRWWSVLPMHLQYFTRDSLTRLLDRHGFDVVWMHTHAKVFTARYYAERLEGYSAGASKLAVRTLQGLGQADRMIGPDLRDRLAVLAVRR